MPATQSDVSKLRSTAENIYCAVDQQEAAHHLRELQKHKLFTPGIPIERSAGNSHHLSATTLDKVLSILADSAKKFPENKDLVEQTVIRWNFCGVIDNETVYDHRSVNGRTVRYASPVADENLWSGFQAFGLMPDKQQAATKPFDFTTPYINSVIKSLADSRMQQRYIQHCLPHPDDEHLYRNYGRNFISRIIPASQVRLPFKEKEWQLECKPGKLQLTHTTLTHNKQQPEPVAISHHQPEPVKTAAPLEGQTATEISNNHPQQPTLAAAIDASVESPQLIPVNPDSGPVQVPAAEPEAVAVKPVAPDSAVTPIAISGPRGGNDIVTPTTARNRGFSGSISLNNRSFNTENTSINFAVSYKPVRDSYWFIRSGFNLSQESQPLTYTWGIGYDDWHAGTWAVQLNNWGPLEPGDGLDIKNAVAEISYKFKSTWLGNNNLASSLSLSKPLSDDPALNWGWSWNPYSHWFVRSTFSKVLGAGGLDWSYGFGYTRYSNKSLSLEYNNWGLNRFPDANFKKNALLSLIYRWQF